MPGRRGHRTGGSLLAPLGLLAGEEIVELAAHLGHALAVGAVLGVGDDGGEGDSGAHDGGGDPDGHFVSFGFRPGRLGGSMVAEGWMLQSLRPSGILTDLGLGWMRPSAIACITA